MLKSSTLVVLLFPYEKKKKPISIAAAKLRFPVSWPDLCLGEERSRSFSACHRATLPICCNLSLTPWKSHLRKHWRFFSFLWGSNLPDSIWHVEKRITSSRDWPQASPIWHVLNRSQIHWPLKVDLAKLWFFNNSNLTLQPCHTCPYWLL